MYLYILITLCCFQCVEQNVTRDMTIRAHDGSLWYLIEVIATILRHLKEQLEDHLSRTINPLKATEFNWVITVPAIWQDRGRRMMREAGYLVRYVLIHQKWIVNLYFYSFQTLLVSQAGLCSDAHVIQHLTEPANGKELTRPPETNGHRLTLAPEPEAAANYCRQMKASDLAKHAMEDGSDSLQSSCYMIVDVGGGTVDITANKVDDSNSIHVLRSPTGNDCGGMMVNLEFMELLQLIFGEKPTDIKHGSSLEDCFPELLSSGDPILCALRKSALNLLIYKSFEDEKERLGNKIGIRDGSNDEEMKIKLPEKVLDYYGVQRIQSHISTHFGDQVDIEDGILYIQNQLLKQLFTRTLEGIVKCVHIVLDDLRDQVDTVYLVGGFGGCKYVYEHLQQLMKSDFSDQAVRVIVPTDHKLAVAQGAVKYKQQKICSRMIDATYGVAVSVKYDDRHHSEEYFRWDHEYGNPICIDAFLTFGAKGDIVKSEDVFVDEVIPGVENEKVIKIPIMRSTRPSLEYATERSTAGEVTQHLADKVGELEMHVNDILAYEQRVFRIMMDFTQSEVKARAFYVTNNEEVETVLNFLATQ